MKMRMQIALALAGFVSVGAALATINAQAEQQAQSDPAAAPKHDHEHEFSAADHAAFFDARLAALHAGLTLTPDQDKLWPPVEAALRDTAKTMAERRKLWKDEPRPADPVQMLQRLSDGALARGEALKKLADAAKPLYATLNDEQKHRLPVLLAHLRPHGMDFAMAGEHGFHPDGERHGWWSHGHHDHDEDHDHDGPGHHSGGHDD